MFMIRLSTLFSLKDTLTEGFWPFGILEKRFGLTFGAKKNHT